MNDASSEGSWLHRLSPGRLRAFAVLASAYLLVYLVLFSVRLVEYARDVVRTFDFVRRWIG